MAALVRAEQDLKPETRGSSRFLNDLGHALLLFQDFNRALDWKWISQETNWHTHRRIAPQVKAQQFP